MIGEMFFIIFLLVNLLFVNQFCKVEDFVIFNSNWGSFFVCFYKISNFSFSSDLESSHEVKINKVKTNW